MYRNNCKNVRQRKRQRPKCRKNIIEHFDGYPGCDFKSCETYGFCDDKCNDCVAKDPTDKQKEDCERNKDIYETFIRVEDNFSDYNRIMHKIRKTVNQIKAYKQTKNLDDYEKQEMKELQESLPNLQEQICNLFKLLIEDRIKCEEYEIPCVINL